MQNHIEVIPQSPVLGAEVRGVDLSRPLDGESFRHIHRALLDHGVIFLRDQKITPQQQLAFAQCFGTPVVYPLMKGLPDCPQISPLIKEPDEKLNFGGDAFHADTTYLDEPPAITMLYAKEVPPIGGDTVFASMYAAYDRLSDGMKRLVNGLTAINTSPNALAYFQAQGPDKPEGKRQFSAEHPVALVVPETGRRALYVNGSHTQHFKDMTREESLPLIEYLCREAVRPELTYRLQWQVGTVTLWDNRSTQHYPLNDYHGHRRVMHRVTIGK